MSGSRARCVTVPAGHDTFAPGVYLHGADVAAWLYDSAANAADTIDADRWLQVCAAAMVLAVIETETTHGCHLLPPAHMAPPAAPSATPRPAKPKWLRPW